MFRAKKTNEAIGFSIQCKNVRYSSAARLITAWGEALGSA